MGNLDKIRKIINDGWYNELVSARNILLNDTRLDPNGTLLAQVEAKINKSNPEDCQWIVEVQTRFKTSSLMTKIPKPQSICSVWHIDQERYPTFFSYLQHLYPELRDIKVVPNKYNYDEAANFIIRNVARKIAMEIPEDQSLKSIEDIHIRLERLESNFDKFNKEFRDTMDKILKALNRGEK
jgi:hypothetical protein